MVKEKGTKSNPDEITFYFSENRFMTLLKESKKYRDLYYSKEALLSFFLSVITVFFLIIAARGESSFSISKIIDLQNHQLTQNGVENVVDLAKNLLNFNLAGLFGLLGFIIGGLSILSGTLSSKVIDTINDEGKIRHLISLMFSFYFAGAIIGVTLVVSILTYISLYTPYVMNLYVLFFWSFFVCYLSYFTIIVSIMLLGTSLRFFLLNHWYVRKQN
ncbi:hypothetical protein [Paenibacillus silvae]|uniref:Uncharacterized protein n=1 Tax=Paenibacillus silvae TaxID=1325358 RepID=A0A2W6P7J6_9BACL|nr:hypothetical protein [Paenibacillus silvae]PZT54116.1 hypothetical protein DN757_18985 [Paenibacillus silvae]